MAPTTQQFRRLFEVVEHHAQHFGAVVAAVDVTGSQLTYVQLEHRASQVAAGLAGRVQGRRPLATWMPRGNDWYCTFVAAARLELPLAALSTDLPEKEVECRRNAEILATHRPALAVLASPSSEVCSASAQLFTGTPTVAFMELLGAALVVGASAALPPVNCQAAEDCTLCYCYTGGSTKASRCALVTHGMALHEVRAYPNVASLAPGDKVLQQHSLYWGASAYGELDIALAFAGTVVFCETPDAGAVEEALRDKGIACAGLVPSVLASLDPSSLPDLRLIFTWGEALTAKTARDWARHAEVVDLLISTECWLSLYARWGRSSTERPPFRLVPGAEAQRSSEGELEVAGPMVTPGYHNASLNEGAFKVEGGARWYQTRDRVECKDGGFIYAGRADDLVKVGGVWRDLCELSEQLKELPGGAVQEAEIVDGRYAFVVLAPQAQLAVLPTARRLLPADFALFAVNRLPKLPGSGKADRKALTRLVAVGRGATLAVQPEEDRRCRREISRMGCWFRPVGVLALGALARALMVAPRASHFAEAVEMPLVRNALPQPLLRLQLSHCSAGGRLVVAAPLGGRRAPPPLRLVLHFTVHFGLQLAVRVICVCYATLLPWYAPWHLHKRANNLVPCGLWGLLLLLCTLLPLWCCCSLLALPAMVLAVKRGRLLSWPLVSVFGLPHWMCEAGWWWASQGVGGSVRWYCSILISTAAWPLKAGPVARVCSYLEITTRPLMSPVVGAWNVARRRLKLARVCAHCKVVTAARGGRADADLKWYCDRCWRLYDEHRQCQRCWDWSTRGQPDTKGLWLCKRCSRQDLQPIAWRDDAATEAVRSEERLAAPRPRQYREVHLTEAAEAAVLELGREEAVPALLPEGRPEEAALSPSEQRCADVVQRATGWMMSSRSDSITGLDSLRVTKVIGALRQETGRHMALDTFRRCRTLGDLLQAVQELKREEVCAPTAALLAEDARREFKTWGVMWKSKCTWCLQRDAPLSERVLQEALLRLAQRHPALRAELRDPETLHNAMQRALSVLTLWDQAGRPGLPPQLARQLLAAARWALRGAWPRVAAGACAAVAPLRVRPHSVTAEVAKRAAWDSARLFQPPFQAVLAAYGAEGEPQGAFILLQVTHMFSDGYSVVPLLSDLGHFIAEVEAETLRPLPALPTALGVMEQRLLGTVNNDESMRDLIGLEPLGKEGRPRDKCQKFVPLPASLVAALKRRARQLDVTSDDVLLAAIAVALAWLMRRGTVPMVLVVPNRDGQAENDLVGLLADVRLLQACCEGLSVAGLALQLHWHVKERLWQRPGLMMQYDLPWVNFQWTDMEAYHGLRQVIELSDWGNHLRTPIGVTGEQADAHSLRLSVVFDNNLYDQEDRQRFFKGLDQALESFLTDPLVPAWQQPEGVRGEGRQ